MVTFNGGYMSVVTNSVGLVFLNEFVFMDVSDDRIVCEPTYFSK